MCVDSRRVENNILQFCHGGAHQKWTYNKKVYNYNSITKVAVLLPKLLNSTLILIGGLCEEIKLIFVIN